MQGTERPEYAECTAIVTGAALRQMVRPAVLALGTPVLVGFIFRLVGAHMGARLLAAEALGSFMMFGSVTGLLMAMFLDNAGGAWDNAKKYIESGAYGGKGSYAHKVMGLAHAH